MSLKKHAQPLVCGDMKTITFDKFVELVKQRTAGPHVTLSDRSYAIRGGVINALLAVPEFARHPEIYPLLEEILFDKRWIEDRNFVSMILHDVGDPRGILHLTYNYLTTHPILKIRQDDLHGWHSGWIFDRAGSLTEECLELLIEDLKRSSLGYFHADLLSMVTAEKIVPRMLPLLEAEGKAAMAAAYVLAMKGRDEGRSILEKLAESQKYVELALIALSHIPDDKTLYYLRTYADPQHAIYERYKNSFISQLLRHAEIRLFLLECRDPHPVAHTMEQFYLHPIQELIAYDWDRQSTLRSLNGPKSKRNASSWPDWEDKAARWINPPPDFNANFFVVNSHLTSGDLGTGVSAPDFLYEFSTPEDRAYCAEIQRHSIRALLNTIDWSHLGNGRDMGVRPTFLWGLPPTGEEYGLRNYYLPSFKISYGPEDYEHAAVGWILEPQKFRFGSYRPLASYEPDPRPKEPEWREYVKVSDPNRSRRVGKFRRQPK